MPEIGSISRRFALAKIEQNGKRQIHREEENLKKVILSAIQVCHEEANNKQIKTPLNQNLAGFFLFSL